DVAAGGDVYLGSEKALELGRDRAGVAGDQRIIIRAGNSLSNVLSDSGTNLLGKDILLEAGNGAIGAEGKPVTVQMAADGSLVARATRDIDITATTGNLYLESVYSASGGARLTAAAGSI